MRVIKSCGQVITFVMKVRTAAEEVLEGNT
jgi:hypothetical protein